MQFDGTCHCGGVTFTAEVDPSQVMICPCTDCQVMSGSAFRHVVPAPIDKFSLSGTRKGYVKVADSGNRRFQFFCPECGTPLYATAPENPTWVSVRLGCVRQRAELSPVAQIWSRSALPWLAGLSALQASPEQQAILVAVPR
jgi:hypothetical protein